MKKVLLLAAMSVLAAALLIPTAFAGNAPTNKVNADLMFTNASVPAHWVFNAQDLPTGDKGNVLDEDADFLASLKASASPSSQRAPVCRRCVSAPRFLSVSS